MHVILRRAIARPHAWSAEKLRWRLRPPNLAVFTAAFRLSFTGALEKGGLGTSYSLFKALGAVPLVVVVSVPSRSTSSSARK